MTRLPNLHDGFFDGLWLSVDKQARLFVRTVEGERRTVHDSSDRRCGSEHQWSQGWEYHFRCCTHPVRQVDIRRRQAGL